MANTFTQLSVQLVFAVKNRQALIKEPARPILEKYITGIVQRRGHKMLAIYLMPDHAHIFIGLSPKDSISTLVQIIKSESTNLIKAEKLVKAKFGWQNGFGAFSYCKREVPTIIRYVLNQPAHHAKKTFKQEYTQLLINREIDYHPDYLFDFFD